MVLKSITLKIHPAVYQLVMDHLKSLGLYMREKHYLAFLVHYGYQLMSDDILYEQAYLLLDAIDAVDIQKQEDVLTDEPKRMAIYLKQLSVLETPPIKEAVYVALLCAIINLNIDLAPLNLGDLFY